MRLLVFIFLIFAFLNCNANHKSIVFDDEIDRYGEVLKQLSETDYLYCDWGFDVVNISFTDSTNVKIEGFVKGKGKPVFIRNFNFKKLKKSSDSFCLKDDFDMKTKLEKKLDVEDFLSFAYKKWGDRECKEIIKKFFKRRAEIAPDINVVAYIINREGHALKFGIAASNTIHINFGCS